MAKRQTSTQSALSGAAKKKAARVNKYPWIAPDLTHLAVPIERLKPSDRNPVDHDEANICAVMGRLKEHGQYHPLIANSRNNQVVVGNCRLEAAKRLKWTHVAVLFRRLTAAQQAKLAIDDNRTADLATWNETQLGQLLDELQQKDPDVFADWEQELFLSELRAELPQEIPDAPEPQIDRATQLQKKWKTKPGQLWEIPGKAGTHRVLCGDSINAEDVGRVMGGEKANACISDPPYGMNWNADASRFSGGKFGNHPRGRERDDIVNDDKPFDPRPFLGYEVVVLWGLNHYCDKLPPGGVLVWLKKPDDRFGTFLSDCELAWTNVGRGVYAFRHEWGDITRKTERGEFWHPTQKAVAVVAWTIEKTKAGPLVLDPFLGSGTTVIACEQLGRVGYGIEIEPKYVAVSLQRLADMGLKPQLAKK